MNDKRLMTGADALADVIDRYRRGIGPELWQTGNPKWNAFEVGPGLISVIAAPPKRGKTALCMAVIADTLIANPGLNAYICNCEVSPAEQMMRLLSRYSGIAAKDIRDGNQGPGDDERLEWGHRRMDAFAGRMIFYTGPFTLADIRDTFGRADAGPGLLNIDYIQRLRSDSGSGDDRRVELENVMSALRGLADAGLGIIVISAVSRQKSKTGSDYAGIGLASLRGSSELEYSADSIWLMHTGEPDAADKNEGAPKPEGLMVFECAANRHGDTASIPLVFDKKRMTFHVMDI